MSKDLSSHTVVLDEFPEALKASLLKNFWGEDPKKGSVRTYMVGFNKKEEVVYIRASSRVELMSSFLMVILEHDNMDLIAGTAKYLEGGKEVPEKSKKVLRSAIKKVEKYRELSPKAQATKKFLRWKNPQRAFVELSESFFEDGPAPPMVVPLDGTSMIFLSQEIFGRAEGEEKKTYKVVKSDLDLENEKALKAIKAKKKGEPKKSKKSKKSSSSEDESEDSEEDDSEEEDESGSSSEEDSGEEEDSSEEEESDEEEESGDSDDSEEEERPKKSKTSKK